MRVLLIEDSDTERELIARLIRRACREQCEIDAVATVARGVALLRMKRYDAVVTDLHVRDASGIDIVEDARTLQPDARRVVVTADPTIEAIQEAMKRGRVHSYLSKGWGSERLLDQLERALAPSAF